MKKKNIAMLMTMAMITSGVTAPMEAVYASDEIQIQSEDVFESENEDALGESTDVTEATEDSFAESTESEATDMSEAEEVEITEDAEQSGDEEIEISEEDSDTEENVADVFSDGAEDTVTYSSEVVESGYCGSHFTDSEDCKRVLYKLYADGTLIIEGTGKIDTYQFQNDDRIKTVQIMEGITNLGIIGAFSNCKNLTSVSLPDSLQSTGSAFYGCESLNSVNIPSGVTTIGYSSFYGCKSLKNITIPDSVTTIEERAFSDCEKLGSLNIPISVKSIGQYAFYHCSSLESINIPATVESVGNHAFDECESVRNVNISSKDTSFGEYVFEDCTDLRSVTLPKGIKTIRKGLLCGCERLADVALPESVTSIEESAFRNCSALMEIVLPQGLTEIGDSAFYNTGFLSIKLPNGLKSIGKSAFESGNFTDIVLPDSLTDIGEDAFLYNRKLESISIPENIKELKKNTFAGCWKLKSVTLAEGLLKIADGAFSYCYSLETITIPDSVTTIGDNSFNGCSSLKSIYFSKNLTKIGYEAFAYCEGLVNVSLPEKLENIDTGAFKGCTALLGLYIPGTNLEIKSRAIGYNSDSEKNKKLVIIGKTGSTAETYAKNTGLLFHNVDDKLTHQTEVKATCVKEGNVEYWHCDSCGQDFSNTQGTEVLDVTTVAKVAHRKVQVPYKDATCTEPGNWNYYRCENCGKKFTSDWNEDNTEMTNEIIPAYGHTWQLRNTGGSSTFHLLTPGKTSPVYVADISDTESYCWRCGKVAKENHVRYVLNVNVDQITLKCGQSSTTFRTWGDPVKSVVPDNNLVKVSGVKSSGSFKVTANVKKTGRTYLTITTTTGLTTKVLVSVQKGAVKTKSIKGLSKSVSVVKGKSVTLKPTLEPVNSPEKITYTSSNKKAATVNAKGVVKGVKPGTAKITVKSGSKKVVVRVKVTGVKTTKLSGVPAAKSVSKGKTFKIKAVAAPKNTSEKITYTSSNKKVATVTAKGVVKGLRKGTATITVKSGSKKMTCKVTVK